MFLFMTLTILFLFFSITIALPPAARDVTNSSKAGIAGGSSQPAFSATGKVSWYYTWSPDAISNTGADLEFVPMLWGQKDVSDWTQNINTTISKNSVKYILGMNEPEETGQSNLTAQEGAQMWITYIEPLHNQGLLLGSPAPTSDPAGKTWLQDFLTVCNGGCTVDFIALHWYDVNATAFIDYLEDFYNTFQRPLWVTEWACQNFVNENDQCSMNDIILFLNQTQSYMDSSDFVERYAWFGVPGVINPDDALYDSSSGKLTQLGEQYIGQGSANGPAISGTIPVFSPSTVVLAELLSITFLLTIVI